MKFISTFLLFSIFMITTSSEAMTISEYKSWSKQNASLTDVYIGGLGNGIFWANAMSEQETNFRLYCQPGKLALVAANYRKILDDEIARNSHKPEDPIELVLLFGLKNVFPC